MIFDQKRKSIIFGFLGKPEKDVVEFRLIKIHMWEEYEQDRNFLHDVHKQYGYFFGGMKNSIRIKHF